MKINYKEKKVLSTEEVNAQELEFAIQESKLQLSSDILATERSLAGAKRELEEAKTEYPLNSQKIVSVTATVDNYEKALIILRVLQKELDLK